MDAKPTAVFKFDAADFEAVVRGRGTIQPWPGPPPLQIFREAYRKESAPRTPKFQPRSRVVDDAQPVPMTPQTPVIGNDAAPVTPKSQNPSFGFFEKSFLSKRLSNESENRPALDSEELSLERDPVKKSAFHVEDQQDAEHEQQNSTNDSNKQTSIQSVGNVEQVEGSEIDGDGNALCVLRSGGDILQFNQEFRDCNGFVFGVMYGQELGTNLRSYKQVCLHTIIAMMCIDLTTATKAIHCRCTAGRH